jgi:hypothetical protein
VSTPDLAIIAMAVVSLASISRDWRLHMKIADRMRLVSPPKTPVQPEANAAAAVESIAAARRVS